MVKNISYDTMSFLKIFLYAMLFALLIQMINTYLGLKPISLEKFSNNIMGNSCSINKYI